MSEIEPLQSSEELESGAEIESARELDQITHEPESSIENMGSVEQSETIESTIKEIVDSSPETQAGGKLDDSKGKYEEPLKELDQELPHQEKLGGQKQLPGQDGMPGMEDMPGSNLPGMDSMPGGKKLPGSDIPGSDDMPGSDLPGSDMPGSDIPGMDGLPGSDILGGYKPDGGDMPGGLPGGDLPGKSGIPGEGGGMPTPPNIYETTGGKGTKGQKGSTKGQKGGAKGQKGGQKGQKGGQKGQTGESSDQKGDTSGKGSSDTRPGAKDGPPVDAGHFVVDVNLGGYAWSPTDPSVSGLLQRVQDIHDMDISRAVDGMTSDQTEDMGEDPPPDAVPVRPGMIPGEEITDPPSPDMAGRGDEMSKPDVIEATTVDPDSGGGRVPVSAVKVRPGMIPGEEITDPPNPDLAGKSSEDAMAAQKGADVQKAGSGKDQEQESDQETGKKGNQ